MTRSPLRSRRTAPLRRRPDLESLEGRALLAAALTEFPGPFNNPTALAVDPAGHIWVANDPYDGTGGSLTEVAADGSIVKDYPVPTPGAQVSDLVADPAGNIWFTEQGADKIGKLTPSTGEFTEYTIPDPNPPAATPAPTPTPTPVPLPKPLPIGILRAVGVGKALPPSAIAVPVDPPIIVGGGGSGPWDGSTGPAVSPTSLVIGSDGAIWFTEVSADAIGRITTDGTITQHPTPNMSPSSLAVGPDGNLWFTDQDRGNAIDRLNADDTVTSFPLPENDDAASGLISGADGALWFVDPANVAIGRMSTGGQVSEIPIRGYFFDPESLAFDTSGNIWVAGYGGGLARVSPQGVTTIVSTNPAADIGTAGVILGPDGAIWFGDNTNNGIGRIDPTTVTTLPTDNPLSVNPEQQGQTITTVGSLDVDGVIVGSFFDGNPAAQYSDFTASIDWGDGSTSAGEITPDLPGRFNVSGDHSYSQFGTYAITITVTDTNSATTPQPNSLTLTASLFDSNQPPVIPIGLAGGVGPVVLTGSGGGKFAPGTPSAANGSGDGKAGSTSHPSKPTPVVSKPKAPANVGPSAAELFRAGFLKNWFMAGHYHPTTAKTTAATATTTPVKPVKKVTAVKATPKPVKVHHAGTKPVKPTPKGLASVRYHW